MAANVAIVAVRDSEGTKDMSEPKILKFRTQQEIRHRITIIQFLMMGVMGAFIFALVMLFHLAKKHDLKFDLPKQQIIMRFG